MKNRKHKESKNHGNRLRIDGGRIVEAGRSYIEGIKIIPIKARHFNHQYVFGYRINNFTYITDAVEIPELEKKKIVGSEIIVINALRKKKHYSHFNLGEALSILQEMKPGKGFLTHISHQMGKHEEINKELPGNIELAFDGLTFFSDSF